VSGRLAALVALALAGCTRLPVLEPAGPFAARLRELILDFTLVSALVWIAVVLALAVAAFRRRRAAPPDPALHPDARAEHRLHLAIAAAVAATVLVLVGLNVASFATDRALSTDEGKSALTIRVTGHQWWWEVTYVHERADQTLTTANEIHIPVGQPVSLALQSADVIHSFWVPELAGKKDLIPGHPNTLVLQADRAGEYLGQCAEFCGLQHARMRLKVIAVPPSAFEAWRQRQLLPATVPETASARRGQEVFLSQPCVMCHTVRGTPAGGKVAPDLTHLASRTTLAAGTLANTRGNLAAWISDAQGVKPGAHMPSLQIAPADLHPLLDYLEQLQ